MEDGIYKVVPGSRGIAPRFAITLDLQEGYGPNAKLHMPDEEVVNFLNGLAKNRIAREF